jgi:hypothetical protein
LGSVAALTLVNSLINATHDLAEQVERHRGEPASDRYLKLIEKQREASSALLAALSAPVPDGERWYITAEWVNDGHHRQLTLTALPFDEHDDPVTLIRRSAPVGQPGETRVEGWAIPYAGDGTPVTSACSWNDGTHTISEEQMQRAVPAALIIRAPVGREET